MQQDLTKIGNHLHIYHQNLKQTSRSRPRIRVHQVPRILHQPHYSQSLQSQLEPHLPKMVYQR